MNNKTHFLVLFTALLVMGITLYASFQEAIRPDAEHYEIITVPRDVEIPESEENEVDIISPSEITEEVSAPEEEMVFCTMDAKQCPDGSYVGRVAPSCAFASCVEEPTSAPEESEMLYCTEAMKRGEACAATLKYEPVCALVEVQCVTTPCNPIPETFDSACSACMQGNVSAYTNGQCTE